MMLSNRTDAATAALAFAATLSTAQRADLLRPYSLDDARRWSNLPQAVLGERGRVGLSTATLDDDQWAALEELLAATTGSGPDRGHDEIRQQLAADDHLLALGGRHGYGRDQFRLAFLGLPSATGVWQLQFGGHHLAVAQTYRDGVLVGATPAFRGIEPFRPFVQDGARLNPGRGRHAALVTLLAGLDRDQLGCARLSRRYPDIVMGPGRDGPFPERVGVSGAVLGTAQREDLLAAVAGWVLDVDDADAERILDGYAAELDATCVAFSGSPALDTLGDYVRIDGPGVWIEYSMHPGMNVDGPHPHSVWRDHRADYGGLDGRWAPTGGPR